MNWDDMRMLLAVARAGRVASAARDLGIEHSTVARRLAKLEAELHASLFHRTAGGYQLTQEGERAIAAAEEMERGALALDSDLRAMSGALAGRVRIALLDEFASHWLAPLLPAFRERYPDIELQVLVGIERLDLSRGEADLAIRFPRPRQAGLTAVRLVASTCALYASRTFLAGKRLRVDADARDLALAVYVEPYNRLNSAPWLQPVLARSKIVMATNSTHALLAAGRAGACIAVVPHFIADQYDELVRVSEDTGPRDDMWLVMNREYRRDPRVRATAEFLRQRARDVGA